MIQRIQTIWFLLASIVFFSLFLFAYVHFEENNTAKALKVTGVYESLNGQIVRTQEFLGLTIVTVIIGIIPLIAIFLFKERKKQVALAYVAIFAILCHFFWLYTKTKEVIGDFQLQPENYGIGIFLPSVTILLLIFAIKGIRKDENLIRSTERLRG